MIFLKELTSSKTFDENEKRNCYNYSIIQCSGAAADKWKKKEWKDDKCRREVDKEYKNKKDCWKEILEEERESWYNNIQCCWCEEFECKNSHEILHRW